MPVDELLKWVAAVPTLLGFGLALGLNPALYGALADSLARNQSVNARLRWMILGLFSGATLLVIVLRTFDPRNLERILRGDAHAAILDRHVDLVVGALFLLGAAAAITWKLRSPKLPVKAEKVPKADAKPLSFFTLGLTCSIVGFTTLPIMYLTGRVLEGLSDHLLLRVVGYCVFLIALAAPFVALAWIWSRFPKLSGRVSEVYKRVLHWDSRWAVAALLTVAGLVFLGLAAFNH